jgi:Flp pilus assembly protein TadD
MVGEQGSLAKLRECQQEFQENPEIAANLARALGALGMHEDAAIQYLAASNLATSDEAEKQRLRGRAAVEFSKAGHKEKAELLLREQRKSLRTSATQQELHYLARLREIATDADDRYAEVEVLERTIQLSPDDWDARFRLAYAYSELNINDMSLYHYVQIPYSERSAVTWNNLGVVYQQFTMPAKAVDAYRIACSKGETLAMSNLAYKFMQAGFLKEADDELQRALKIDDFHRNVGEAVSALKDIPEAEKRKLKESLAAVEPKRQFFHDLAAAATLADLEELPQRWIGPDCELSVSISNGEFRAFGEYDRKTGGLGMAFTSVAKTTHYKLTFTGQVRGNRVIGTFTRKSDDEKLNAGALALLGDGSDETEFAMVVAPGAESIAVVERQSSTSPRFYTLRPAKSEAQPSLAAGT